MNHVSTSARDRIAAVFCLIMKITRSSLTFASRSQKYLKTSRSEQRQDNGQKKIWIALKDKASVLRFFTSLIHFQNTWVLGRHYTFNPGRKLNRKTGNEEEFRSSTRRPSNKLAQSSRQEEGSSRRDLIHRARSDSTGVRSGNEVRALLLYDTRT